MGGTRTSLIEGCAIAAPTRSGGGLLHLHPRRVRRRRGSLERGGRRGATRRASSARTSLGIGLRPATSYVHRGAGAYICGEETALMNSLEGKRGNPRHQAAVPGGRPALFGMPDDDQQRRDARRRAAHPRARRRVVQGDRLASPKSTGTKLFSVSRPRASARATTRSRWASRCKELLYDLCGGMLPTAGRSRRSSPAARRCRS